MKKELNEKDITASFGDVVKIIEASRTTAFRKVNEELINMYRQIGEYNISGATKEHSYGDGYIQKLADYFEDNHPELKGFNRRGLYRMKQFYEMYAGTEIVSTLLTQLGWSSHLKIMSACKTLEERRFYMEMSAKDDEVVEYALSRSLSPTMVSEYTLKLIDKKLLQQKLKEYIELSEFNAEGEY